MRILHAIHDFLPRHRAGAELYAHALAREQIGRGHHVHVLCAEYDPRGRHGAIAWRRYGRVPVVEITNNWAFRAFADTYRSPYLANRVAHVLDATAPDVVHIHNLLNLTFDLPAIAKRRGAVVVATLHDYTLLCVSGGQRVHVAEAHVCGEIDPERCARCFAQSPWHAQMQVARAGGGVSGLAYRAARALHARAPALAASARALAPAPRVTPAGIAARLEDVRHVFDAVDRFVAPSRALADEYVRFGLPAAKLEVSDYGFPRVDPARRDGSGRLRIGFIGTIVWHKGVHVLLDAAAALPQDAIDVQIHGDPDCFPPYGRTLRRTAAPLPSVRFMGAFAEERLGDVLAGIDVLVVPSLWPENSPLVIHEAFMAGVPVVGARTGGIPELVRDGACGLLYAPESSGELASALRRLVDDRALLERLARGVPPVKTIERDADEWDARYRRL